MPIRKGKTWSVPIFPLAIHPSPIRILCAVSCAALIVAACATLPPAGTPGDTALHSRIGAILEHRGLGADALSVIDNIIRHDLTPPRAAPPIVREYLAAPLAAADAAASFDRAVPGALRRWVEEIGDRPRFSSPDLAQEKRGLSPISPPLRKVLDAYLVELAEAQHALRMAARGPEVDAGALVAQLRTNLPSLNRMQEVAAAYDGPLLRRATTLFLNATARFTHALRAGGAQLEFPETGARFDSAIGLVVIGTRGDDVHGPDAAVIVDPGGDDQYLRAPATGGAISVIVDLGGDDRYLGSDVAVHALSALVDFSGADVYAMAGPGLGAAVAGASLVIDLSGDDRYSAEVFGQGAAAHGLGAIVDLNGDDRYRLRAGGQGFGLAEGVGVLWDRGGNDTYESGGLADFYGRGGGLSWAQGAAFGYRTALGGGIGILRDDAGNDTYQAQMYAQGAGYYYGLALLWDHEGDDRFRATRYAQGAGVHEAVGVLRDDSGNDIYELTFGVGQGMGLDLAVGILLDGAGNDRYRAPQLAQGAATANGLGVLADASGADHWHVDDARQAWGRAQWLRGLPTVGLLVYDSTHAGFTRKEGDVTPPPGAAGLGIALGNVPVEHERPAGRRCPDPGSSEKWGQTRLFNAEVVSGGKVESDPVSLAEALRRLAPAFAGGNFDPAVYNAVQQRLTAQLEASLAELPRGDFDVTWSLGEALRCVIAGASPEQAAGMWAAMERVLAKVPATPYAGVIAGALRERPAPVPQMESLLAALDTHPACGVRSAALRLRGRAHGDARASALRAAQAALQSPCWRLQASALAVLTRLGAPPADTSALPTFLRGAQFVAKQ